MDAKQQLADSLFFSRRTGFLKYVFTRRLPFRGGKEAGFDFVN